MEPFEYVIVLSSLILGLCIAQILNGAADLLADVRKTKFSLTHSFFIAVVFMVTIQDWFYTYQYSKQVVDWTLAVVMAILVFPLVLFILARFIYPTGARSQERDMAVYFSENWRWLYGLFASTIVISMLQNYFISGIAWVDQVHLYIYFAVYMIYIVGNFKNLIYHRVFMIAQFLLWMSFLVFDTSTLN